MTKGNQVRKWFGVTLLAASLVSESASDSELSFESGLRLRHVSSWPGHGRGAVFSVALAGNKAFYTAANGGVVVLDISEPTNLRATGGFGTFDHAGQIVVNGSRAYVTTPFRLDVFEVDRLPSITWDGGVQLPGLDNYIQSLEVVGTNAFIGSRSGLMIYDVSKPEQPVLAGRFESKGDVMRLAVRNGIAFAVDDQVGLQVIDVRKEIRPIWMSSITNTAPPGQFPTDPDLYTISDVAVENGYAFLAGGTAGVLVVDIADLRNPKIVKTVKLTTGAYLLKTAEGVCVPTDGGGSLFVIDIRNPREAAVLGERLNENYIECTDLQLQGEFAYLAVRDGVISFDIRNGEPKKISSYRQTEGLALEVQKVGNHLYVADREGGVAVLDVSDVKRPKEVSRYTAPGLAAYDLQVDGNRAYVAGSSGGLQVLDVSDPTQSTPIVRTNTFASVHSLVERSNIVYAGTQLGIEVWDFNEVAAPKRLARAGRYPVVDVDIFKNHVFAAEFMRGLNVFEVSGTNISEVASRTGSDYRGVKIHDGLAFLSGWGVTVYNANDVTDWRSFHRFPTSGIGHDFDAEGDLGVLADGGSVRLIDLRNSTNLVELDSFALFGNVAVGATISGTNVFVAREQWGVDIFEIVPRAKLEMPVMSNGVMQLRWAPSGAWLERCTDLAANRWEYVPTAAGATVVDVPVSGGLEFYRLVEN